MNKPYLVFLSPILFSVLEVENTSWKEILRLILDETREVIWFKSAIIFLPEINEAQKAYLQHFPKHGVETPGIQTNTVLFIVHQL